MHEARWFESPVQVPLKQRDCPDSVVLGSTDLVITRAFSAHQVPL